MYCMPQIANTQQENESRMTETLPYEKEIPIRLPDGQKTETNEQEKQKNENYLKVSFSN